MPKAKKQTLTKEERLARALVPENEQPYEVPGNWVWVRLENVVSMSVEKTSTFSKDVKYLGLEHFEKDRGIVGYGDAGDVKSIKNSFAVGDILYGKLRPYLNKHDIAPFKGVCSTDILVFKPAQNCDIRLVNFFLDMDNFIEYTVTNSKGINLPRVSPRVVLSAPYPLPPLAEQHRIVNRIESLFSKLDRAKELAQSALDRFETRKAFILHKAFTGELIGLSQVRQYPLSEFAQDIRIGPFGTMLHAEDYVMGGTPVINPKHIVNQIIIPQENVTVSKEKAAELSPYILKENDIILGRRGEMGRTAPISKNEDGWVCGTGSMIIRLKSEYHAPFYSAILSSQSTVEYLEKNAVGSTMKNLNERIIKNIPVPMFSQEEQQKTICILDSLLEKEQQARQHADIIEKIDLMKKAILARAFRGELGTNDPSEESAIKLLQ